MIPLPKPGRNPEESKSYRSIALLSPVAKLLEKLILPELERHFQLADHQHGFRKLRSTTTALNCLNYNIKCGLNKSKQWHRTLLVAMDFKAAFDTVSHGTLLHDIFITSLHSHLKRWLMSYLQDRRTSVELGGASSKVRKVKQGVPQGGVLSPLLFNRHIRSLTTPPGNVSLITYADDITVTTSGPLVDELPDRLIKYIAEVSEWLEKRRLVLTAEKSTAALFTTLSTEVSTDPQIFIKGEKILVCKNPKILGVTFDRIMKFTLHGKITGDKVQSRNNILKKLAGTTWGCSKETLITSYTSYKVIGRSVLNYAAPIWSPNLSDTNWRNLQTVKQNAALLIATGNTRMAPINHLHAETKILHVKEHNELLSEQFLLGSFLPERADHYTTAKSAGQRDIRPHLLTLGATDLDKYIQQGRTTISLYKKGLSELHRKAVENAIKNPSKLLGEPPPAVAKEAEVLSRETRCKLSQLRSGYSTILQNYKHRVDTDIPDECPLCQGSLHNTKHLFKCPTNPTPLKTTSLWEDPKSATEFLNLEPSNRRADRAPP